MTTRIFHVHVYHSQNRRERIDVMFACFLFLFLPPHNTWNTHSVIPLFFWRHERCLCVWKKSSNQNHSQQTESEQNPPTGIASSLVLTFTFSHFYLTNWPEVLSHPPPLIIWKKNKKDGEMKGKKRGKEIQSDEGLRVHESNRQETKWGLHASGVITFLCSYSYSIEIDRNSTVLCSRCMHAVTSEVTLRIFR